MDNTISNKTMMHFHLFPLRFFHFLYNIISSFLLSHCSSFGSLLLFFKLHLEEKFEEVDIGSSNMKSTRFEETRIDDENECYLLGEEVNMVMKRLGIEKHGFLGMVKNIDEISRVFEEEEMNLEEVKEAFGVFDQDKDGFIDAWDLQRVLLALGFKEGIELKTCQNMIRVFDNDGDQKINFCEFLKMV